MTVRDPRRPSRDNYTGQVPMARCGWKGIPFESMIEMDFLMVTDAFLRTLLGIEAQPLIVEYFFDGRHCRWIPDFALAVSDDPRRILVEVKTLLDLYSLDQWFGKAFPDHDRHRDKNSPTDESRRPSQRSSRNST